MICPHCGNDNLPGNEECVRCSQDMTQLDRPVPGDPVERSLIEDPIARLKPPPGYCRSGDQRARGHPHHAGQEYRSPASRG